MSIMNTKDTYGTLTRAMHWLTAIAISVAWVSAQFMHHGPRGAGLSTSMQIHAFLGMIVLPVVMVRLLNNVINRSPAYPDGVSLTLQKIAKATKYVLYVFMALLPVTGILLLMAFRTDTDVLGIIQIPALFDSRIVHGISEGLHNMMGNLIVFVVLLHAAAGIWHQARRDSLAGRMFGRKPVDVVTVSGDSLAGGSLPGGAAPVGKAMQAAPAE